MACWGLSSGFGRPFCILLTFGGPATVAMCLHPYDNIIVERGVNHVPVFNAYRDRVSFVKIQQLLPWASSLQECRRILDPLSGPQALHRKLQMRGTLHGTCTLPKIPRRTKSSGPSQNLCAAPVLLSPSALSSVHRYLKPAAGLTGHLISKPTIAPGQKAQAGTHQEGKETPRMLVSASV